MVFTEDIFAEDDVISLNRFSEEDDGLYFRIMQEDPFCPSPPMDRPDILKLWRDDFLSERRFYCMVTRKIDGKPMGYCGINDINKNDWEIAVMLLNDYQGKGYGRRMTMLLMERLAELTGRKEYFALVEPKNINSHLFFRCLGFAPAGVFKLVEGMPDSFYKQVEDENISSLDDWTFQLAKQFCVEPRILLSHVTRYKKTLF